MSEDRLDQIVFAVVDFANALEAAIINLKKNVKDLAQFKEYDLEEIAWNEAQGEKGPYEKTDDVNNDHYKALIKDLKTHGGKFRKAGYFVWLFRDNKTIGRKKV